MNPFDAYPDEGQALLGRPKNTGNCRRGYGVELQRLTGQTNCAYCGVSLVDDYYHWLLMSVDHVVPQGEAQRLGILLTYYKDFINLVLCCAGCNGFDNRYPIPNKPQSQWNLQEFLILRNETFAVRFQRIATRREAEQKFYSDSWGAHLTTTLSRDGSEM